MLLLLQGCCSSGCCSSKSGETIHILTECGIQLELPNHFGNPKHSPGCFYDWIAEEGKTSLSVTAALPGDTGQAAEASTAMAGENVDYAKSTTFGGLSGKERRTQQKVGEQTRAVWTGFFTGPKGGINLKIASIQEYSADQFGETFWKSLQERRIRPIK